MSVASPAFQLLIFLIFCSNLAVYVLGIKVADRLSSINEESYRKYGSPRFLLFGVSEYKLLFLYILFGDFKRSDLDETSEKLIGTYRVAFLSNLLLFVVFLIAFVMLNSEF